jgi:hypothetical protein
MPGVEDDGDTAMNSLIKQNLKFLLVLAAALFWLEASAAKPEKVTVTAANPNAALQGEALDVVISGSGFGHGSTVRFLVTGTRDDTQIGVGTVDYDELTGDLLASIQVLETAQVVEYDIEVRASSGRGGKGTTLFRVRKRGEDHRSGVEAALNCELVTVQGGTFLSDGLGLYEDGVDKVACGHSGTNSTYGIQLNTVSKGAIKRAIRKIDLAFGSCILDYDCVSIPPEFLEEASNPEDMEDVWIGTGPYPEMDHISLLPPGNHEMKSHIVPQGYADRFVIQLISRDPFPPELGQGLWCNMENSDFVWADAATVEDMTVCIWPDDNGDSLPDGYTITTGDTNCLTTWPQVIPREREATICSTAGDHPCDPDMCNVLGTVPLQLTLHATYQ